MELLPAAFYALKSYNQFIIYKVIPSTKRPGKTDKIPVNPRTGHTANAHDRNAWMTADDAINARRIFGNNFGVGFVFTAEDPFWFLDIDNCLTDGDWSPLAKDLLQRTAGAAVEVSVSGQGLHIIGSGKLPAHRCRNDINHIELYSSGRFVALTGHQPAGDAGYEPPGIYTVLQMYFTPTAGTDTADGAGVAGDILQQYAALCTLPRPAEWHTLDDDEQLLARMLRPSVGKSAFSGAVTFADLWDANEEALANKYPDPERQVGYDESAADAALAQHLCFWTGNDPERIKRFMLKSGLARDKYHLRPDYLPRTIIGACSRQTDWLNDKKVEHIGTAGNVQEGQPRPEATGGTKFLTIPEQIEYFKGCVYVADENKIFVPNGELYKPEVFRSMFGGVSMPVDSANSKVSKNAYEIFTESPGLKSPKVDSTCFRPDQPSGVIIRQDARSAVNIWVPVNTPCVAMDVTRFLRHVDKLWPDPRDAAIATAYMAALVQYMGTKFQWCILVQGVEGNGKSLLSFCVAYAIGERYVHYPKASEIASKFNDWLYGNIFAAVEDIYVSDGRTEVLEALKPMISQTRQEVEPKGGKKVTRDICINFIINTNHKDGLRKTRNDRRIAPLHTAQQSLFDLQRDGMDGDYFHNLFGWLNGGGLAGVNHFLRNYQIPDEFNPATYCKRAPVTSSTETAIVQSSGRVEQEIQEAIESNEVGFRQGWISSTMLDRFLERIQASRKIAHNRRHELLADIGFIKHPGLKDGRATTVVMPDGNKPRLYVRNNHHTILCVDPLEISKRYEHDQK